MIKHLKTPLSDNDIKELTSGDIVYISGTLITARDEAHKRAKSTPLPEDLDLSGAVLYHTGPIVKDNVVLAAGPTTSMRMDDYEPDFLEKYDVKLIVGKGGMGEKTKQACIKHNVCHGIYPGGCGVLAANAVKKVDREIWPDLGMPEAVWVLTVEDFGPVTINIDSKGGDLMTDNIKKYREKAGI